MKIFSLLLAAFIIALVLFAVCYWLIGISYEQSLSLGIVVLFSGLAGELVRYYFFPKKPEDT